MTVLFCDVVGSTGLRTRLGDDAADVFNATLTAALSAVVEDAGGAVVKTLGDGLMAVFGSTVAAAALGEGNVIAAHGGEQGGGMPGQRHPAGCRVPDLRHA